MLKTDLEIKNRLKKFTKRTTYALAELLILKTLTKAPAHGYKINLNLKRDIGFYFGPSTIYPILTSLLNEGYILREEKTSHRRQIIEYRITYRGKAFLKQCQLKHSMLIRFLQD